MSDKTCDKKTGLVPPTLWPVLVAVLFDFYLYHNTHRKSSPFRSRYPRQHAEEWWSEIWLGPSWSCRCPNACPSSSLPVLSSQTSTDRTDCRSAASQTTTSPWEVEGASRFVSSCMAYPRRFCARSCWLSPDVGVLWLICCGKQGSLL